MISALQSGKYDVNKVALMITQTGGGCRASNYIHLLRKALQKAGLGRVPVISLNISGLESNSGFSLTLEMLYQALIGLTYGDLFMLLKNKKGVLVDFYATWCAPCRMIAPTLKELAKEYQDSIYVFKVDVDKEKELSAAIGIQSMPTIMFIPTSGQPQVIIGAADKNTFRRAIKEVLLKE